MLKPAALFTDGVVLCRRKEIRIFGEAESGSAVSVTLEDREGTMLAEGCCTGRDGRFLALLRPQEAQTDCRLTIASGNEKVTVGNVSIGEVFLAGGQSNMELELRNADGGEEAIRSHRDPQLRFFNVPKTAYDSLENRKAAENARWHALEPGEGGENSGVAYFFACALRKRLPDIPIGIIGCYWGGTSVTCWMSEEVLRSSAEGTRYLEEDAARCAGKTMDAYLAEEAAFAGELEAWNRSVEVYRGDRSGATWDEITEACGLCPWHPPAGPGSPYRPAGLVDTMLRRVVPAALTAILYYQGEEDTGRTDHYDLLMTDLIRFWRAEFLAPEVPFLFVQLPMWLDFGAKDTFRWPLTRRSQAAVRDAVNRTGMVCLLDQGEYGNIHPTNKRPVGERLEQLAGAMLYGGGEVSPRAVGKYTEGGVLTVTLSAPVMLRGGKEAALLEIAGETGEYVPARAEIAGDRLRLWAEGISCPVHARYAWTDWSEQVYLFGANGLPLEPFDL